MLDKRIQQHMRHFINAEVSNIIANSRNISPMDGLRLFLKSEVYCMLSDDDLEMWEFSPLALFDMWENEITTGDPRNSLYLRDDEIG